MNLHLQFMKKHIVRGFKRTIFLILLGMFYFFTSKTYGQDCTPLGIIEMDVSDFKYNTTTERVEFIVSIRAGEGYYQGGVPMTFISGTVRYTLDLVGATHYNTPILSSHVSLQNLAFSSLQVITVPFDQALTTQPGVFGFSFTRNSSTIIDDLDEVWTPLCKVSVSVDGIPLAGTNLVQQGWTSCVGANKYTVGWAGSYGPPGGYAEQEIAPSEPIYFMEACDITLTSGVGSDTITVCEQNPITPITYTTNGIEYDTDIDVTSLPGGLEWNWDDATNELVITGTPDESTAGVHDYTITLASATCNPPLEAYGRITVYPPATVPEFTVTCDNSEPKEITEIQITNFVSGNTYSLDGGSTWTPSISSWDAGTHTFSGLSGEETYTVTVRNSNGCEASATADCTGACNTSIDISTITAIDCDPAIYTIIGTVTGDITGDVTVAVNGGTPVVLSLDLDGNFTYSTTAAKGSLVLFTAIPTDEECPSTITAEVTLP